MARNAYENYAERFRELIVVIRTEPTREANLKMTALCFSILSLATGVRPESVLDAKYHYFLTNPVEEVVKVFEEVGLELLSKIEGRSYRFVVQSKELAAHYQIHLPFYPEVLATIHESITIH